MPLSYPALDKGKEAIAEITFDIAKVLDLHALQAMMDDLYDVTQIGFSLIDLKGNLLVGTGWQDICLKFHRKNPQTLKHCRESDLELTKGVKEGEYRIYKCKNGLIDIVTPLFIDEKHVANIFSGQFFFEDEPEDVNHFVAQAEKYGFDKKEYLYAVQNVPKLKRAEVERLMVFYTQLTKMLSRKGLANLELAKTLQEACAIQKKLNESKDDLNRAQAVAKTGSWRITIKGDLFWSDETYLIFGIPNGTEMSYDKFLQRVHPDDREYVNQQWAAALNGKPYDIEHRIIVNESIIWVREKAELECDQKGGLLGGFGTVQDITDRKKTAEALLRAQIELQKYTTDLERLVEERTKQLKDSERLAAIGATAGMVGHDIRNPLHSMMGEVYLLKQALRELPKDHPAQKEVQESLDSLEQNIVYINKIVSDLQDFTRPLKPSVDEVNLKDVIDSTIGTIQIPDSTRAVVKVPEELVVKTDATFLRRIITNLALNSIQAMPNGGLLTIQAFNLGSEVKIVFDDTGVGISEEVKFNLFKPLFTTKSKGQGLGLAVVKRLVEALKGTITFESQEGKGTKFTIELPQS